MKREIFIKSLKWIAATIFFGMSTIFIAIIMAQEISANDETAFDAQKAGFAVKYKDVITPYRVIGAFVLPGEKLILEVMNGKDNTTYTFRAEEGKAIRKADNTWQWESPGQSGSYALTITDNGSGETILLNVFVMVPYKKIEEDRLNGYRIGKYPAIPLKQLPIYKPPSGFIEVTEENEETLISPHFRLKQFVCKQNSGYPKYVVLKERLLLKLELILERVNEQGYPCDTFHIMSGYRTPYYNKVIGNVKYSQHLWGGAADIYIDEDPKDDMMDDLNGDGKNNYHDAAILYNVIDSLYGKPFYEFFLGGLGIYKKTDSHGPFVHVDVRGFRARWGK